MDFTNKPVHTVASPDFAYCFTKQICRQQLVWIWTVMLRLWLQQCNRLAMDSQTWNEQENHGFRLLQDFIMWGTYSSSRICIIYVSIWSIQLGIKILQWIVRQHFNLSRLKMSKLSRLFRYVVSMLLCLCASVSLLLLLPSRLRFWLLLWCGTVLKHDDIFKLLRKKAQ